MNIFNQINNFIFILTWINLLLCPNINQKTSKSTLAPSKLISSQHPCSSSSPAPLKSNGKA